MLDKFLARHKDTCTHYVFSCDRHCSCGRDEAEAELAELRAQLAAAEKLWGVVDEFWLKVLPSQTLRNALDEYRKAGKA